MGLFMFFVTAGSRSRPRGLPNSTPIPLLSTWESNMNTYGQVIGDAIVARSDLTSSTTRNYTYYDGQRVMYQIADYRSESSPWNTYADKMELVYRDNYASPANYAVAGEWCFPHGLYEDYVRNGDTTSKGGIDESTGTSSLINDYPFANTTGGVAQGTPGWWVSGQSRPVSYCLHNNILYERLGNARQTTIVNAAIEFLFDHITQWTTKTFKDTNPDYPGRTAPFMIGLACEALIAYYDLLVDNAEDPSTITWPIEDGSGTQKTILEMVQQIGDHLMDTTNCVIRTSPTPALVGEPMWVEDTGGGYGAFRYQDTTGTGLGTDQTPSHVLGLLVAPLYAWLYKMTGESNYQVFGDKVWAGGIGPIDSFPLSNGKQFNQMYRWSNDYVEWRA